MAIRISDMGEGDEMGRVKAKADRKRIQIPEMVDKAGQASRIRRAIEDQGYERYTECIEALNRALPGITISASTMSSTVNGNKMIRLGRLVTLAYLLGLDATILLPELFDRDGRPITRRTHRHLFPRRFPQRGNGDPRGWGSPRKTGGHRTVPEVS